MNNGLWERQSGEPSKAYAKFCTYRDLGPSRSIPKALAKVGKSSAKPGYWQKIAARWNWTGRCDAFDAHVDAERRSAQLEEIVEMNRRQAALAVNALAKLVSALNSINWATITPADFARILDVATKVERLARGAETDRTANEHSGTVKVESSLRQMSDVDLRAAIIQQFEQMGHTRERAEELWEALHEPDRPISTEREHRERLIASFRALGVSDANAKLALRAAADLQSAGLPADAAARTRAAVLGLPEAMIQ